MAYLYGVLNQKDLYASRVTEIGVEVVMDAVTQSVAEHERQMMAINGLFVEPTTDFKTRFWSVTAARLQPLDDSGRARKIKPGGQYDVSYPIHSAGAAWGTDYVTSKKMTMGEVARITNMMQDADMRWNRDHVLAALFYKSTTNPWTFKDPMHGDLSIYGLANGDTTTYQIVNGADQNTTDDHVKGAASLTAAVYTDIRVEIEEHPENTGPIIALIPTNLRATTEGLTGYIEIADPNIRLGANTAQLIGSLNTPIPGKLIGYIDGVWIVEWRSMPDNYIIAVSTGGDKVLKQREDEEAVLRGFKKVADRNDHPWYEQQWLRRAGFGAWNRVGAVVYRVDSATYAIPSGYSSPMA
jgi:hypothetical protein